MNGLEELERLAAQATPGPWVVGNWVNCVLHTNPAEYRQTFFIPGQPALSCRPQDAAYIVAACNAVPELIARVRELERQRDWLIRYAWIDTNAPCPYEMGHFDQKKICPCWTPYHDWEKAEDMSRDDWHDLLMEGVMTEEDKVNCATDFCECLLVAAEQAAKEAGE